MLPSKRQLESPATWTARLKNLELSSLTWNEMSSYLADYQNVPANYA